MATSLVGLSPEAIGRISDLIGATALFRVLLVGNTTLNNKIFTSTRRFEHDYSRKRCRARWPAVLASFRALEHVSISVSHPSLRYGPDIVYEVDLLALPSTVRTLKLQFSNALLCLVTLPPLDFTGGAFTPHLRDDIKHKFKNLEKLDWHGYEPRDWNLKRFEEALVSWPLELKYPPWLSLSRAARLPPTVSTLSISLKNPTTPSVTKYALPTSLQLLKVCKDTVRDPDRTMAELYNLLASDVPFLSGLRQLTSLQFDPKEFDQELVALLPRTLVTLSFTAWQAEVESFAYLPPGLKNFDATFYAILSSTTGEREEFPGASAQGCLIDGLPDSFLPSMRHTFVEKLPAHLESISSAVWALIRPEDWEAFPSKDVELSDISVAPHHAPYIVHLPRRTLSITVGPTCTQELAELLPVAIRQLTLRLSPADLPFVMALIGIEERLRSYYEHIRSLFKTLSLRNQKLDSLDLEFKILFDWDLLHHLHLPNLDTLTLRYIMTLPGPNVSSEWLTPPLFSQLRHLTLYKSVLNSLSGLFGHLLQACTELELLVIDPDATNPALLPCASVPFLPAKLKYLICAFERLDAEIFKTLPRSLQELIIPCDPTTKSSQYTLHDIALLPRTLTRLYLPRPMGPLPSKEDADAILRELASYFDVAPNIHVDSIDTTLGPTSGSAKLAAMISLERHSRRALPDDSLPEPRRMKRKHRS